MLLIRSFVSVDTQSPTVGEKDRTIKVRVSSLLSDTLLRGLAVDDFPNLASDSESLPFGEPDLDNTPERVLVLDAMVGGLDVRRGRLVADVSGDSFLVGDLVFRTSSAENEEAGGSAGAPSLLGEVMDSAVT